MFGCEIEADNAIAGQNDTLLLFQDTSHLGVFLELVDPFFGWFQGSFRTPQPLQGFRTHGEKQLEADLSCSVGLLFGGCPTKNGLPLKRVQTFLPGSPNI